MFLKSPEDSFDPQTKPKSSRKLLSVFLKAPKNFSSFEIPRKVTGANSSPAFENVYGNFVGDKMADVGALFLKRLII